MRQLGIDAFSFGLLFAPFLIGSSALASPCRTPRGAKEKFELAKYLRKQYPAAPSENSHFNDLLFVFMDSNGNFDPSETASLTIDPHSSTAEIPKEVLKKAARPGISVHVFHRNSISAYVIPIAPSRMKTEFKMKEDCAAAKAENRRIGAPAGNDIGCEVVNLLKTPADPKHPAPESERKLAGATLFYDQSATSCETFSRLAPKLDQGAVKRKSKEWQDLATAINSFNSALGTDATIGDFTGSRKPAFSKIIYSKTKSQEIGTSREDPTNEKTFPRSKGAENGN
jgi:hypothetical protein